VFHLLTTREPYNETTFARNEELHQTRLESKLRKQARQLGFEIVLATPRTE
jgi:hypothetical protein